MGLTVGIDLGTTNSAIAYVDAYDKAVIIPNTRGESVTPSCVAFRESGVIVGSEAKALKQAGDPSVAAFFKREMGNEHYLFSALGQDYSATDLSALVIRQLKRDAETALGQPVTDAVITVPAYFRETERRNTTLAGEQAGLNILCTINEPTAAALAYGADKSDTMTGQRVLVYDLGGGTFDATLLDILQDELRVISSEGDYRLGGKDWDERVVDYLMDTFRQNFGIDPCDDIEFIGDLLIRAEEAKKRLTSALSTSLSLRHGGHSGRYDLSRELFCDLTGDLMQRTRALCDKLLTQSRVAPAGVDHVLLVGGSTRMPMVHDLITELFGKAPLLGVNVDEAVALGAALQARQLNQDAALQARQLDQDAALQARQLNQDAALQARQLGQDAAFSQGQPNKRASAYPNPSSPASSLGRATYKYSLAPSRKVHDVTNHSLGAIALSANNSRYVNEILLHKDTSVPCRNARHFVLDVRPQGTSVMDIYLTQGETTSPADMTYMGKHVVRKIPGNASGKARIEVTYSYDAGGMVRVSAKDTLSGQDLPVTRETLAPGEEARFLGSPADAARYEVMHTHILLVMDLSASMEGDPLEEARKAAHRFVDELDLTLCSVGLAATADKVRLICAPTHNPKVIKNAIDSLQIGMERLGFGNESHPFDLVHEVLYPLSDERTVAVILADGIWYKQELAVEAATRCHNQGIAVVAIGFGTADKKFLKSMASTDEAGIFTPMHELSETFSRIAKVVGGQSSEYEEGSPHMEGSPGTHTSDKANRTGKGKPGMLGLLWKN